LIVLKERNNIQRVPKITIRMQVIFNEDAVMMRPLPCHSPSFLPKTPNLFFQNKRRPHAKRSHNPPPLPQEEEEEEEIKTLISTSLRK
jgi:hypothetical protein